MSGSASGESGRRAADWAAAAERGSSCRPPASPSLLTLNAALDTDKFICFGKQLLRAVIYLSKSAAAASLW